MKKWPVTKKVEDFLLKCDVHKDKNLELFCNNRSELCCTHCAFLNHRHCQKVTLISDIVKGQSTDLQQLSVSMQTILKEMKKLQDSQEASIQSVQSSYDEQLCRIQVTRGKINAALDTIEQKTLKEMKDTLTKLQASSKSAVDKCIRLRDELKQLRDAIQDISDKRKLELSFIATRICTDIIEQSDTFLKKNSLQGKFYLTFQPYNEIVHYLATLSGLGRIEHSTQTLMVQENPSNVFTVQGKSSRMDRSWLQTTLRRKSSFLTSSTRWPSAGLWMGSHSILQVDSEGRSKLATLATQEDGVVKPHSVYYNKHTASILVGLKNSILVFKVE
ncbi:uncharacterized protein LOC127849003 [Dreissena polymorpha]|uniref:uncharacterized protein LOC127849003 n=1 Tax=Dreissena polymorpha TaxID=45954 RepID=UPI0022650A24|nr:uncharacterized protein LOC127849003 [Dreissena polymorpha]